MRSPRAWAFSAAMAAGITILAAASGCGRNSASTVLTPTGIRPSPGVPTGAIYGYIFYDSDSAATTGIRTAPFPRTIVQLEQGATVLQRDTLAPDSIRFHFEGVAPGAYTVRIVAQAFLQGITPGLRVIDKRVDVGNLRVALPGSLFGLVVYDPQNAPDLNAPPYVRTFVEARLNGITVQRDTLAADSSRFAFQNLSPGIYSIAVFAQAFSPMVKNNFLVSVGKRTDASSIQISLDDKTLKTTSVNLLGDIPGFGLDQVATYDSGLDQNQLGVWTYPNIVYPDGAAIPAGTYRFKFITDPTSTLSNLIGWGGSPATTLEVPFNGTPIINGSGPSTDIVAHFPVTAVYQIRLDERLKTLSINPVPTAAAARVMRIHR